LGVTEQQAIPVCYRHPGRETYIRCTRCNRPICPDCMNEASVGFQCPECVRAGVRSTQPARTAFGGGQAGRRGYVTKALIAVNALVYLGIVALGGVHAAIGSGANVLAGGTTRLELQLGVIGLYGDGGALHGVAAGEYYRLITAMFVHLSILHIATNMWALWILGRYLETTLGPARYLALYLVCGFGGNVVVYLFSAPNQLSAGASTAIFGLFAAIFFVNRKLGLSNSGLIVLIVINLGITFLVPQISIWGHLGGLVTGVLAGLGLAYAPRAHRVGVQAATLGGLAAVLVVLTVVRTLMLV
jgi:membrane associated rhomboid family serine protease